MTRPDPGVDDRPWRCPRDHTCRASARRRHDDHNAYLAGCRSGLARHHHNAALARYRAGHCDTLVDATGTARKLQALALLGHTAPAIAAVMGYDRAVVSRLTKRGTPRIHSTTAARVHQAWLELSETEPHLTNSASRARNAATRHGWAPVEAWDHTDIDDPHAHPWEGHPEGTVTALGHRAAGNGRRYGAALDAAVAELTAAGHPATVIADRVGCTVRTVERARARLRAAARTRNDAA